MVLYLREDLAEIWKDSDPFLAAATQQGEIFREREGRRTLRFRGLDKSYFLKYHGGIGWGEIVKNVAQLKWPVVGAMSEVQAIRAIEAVGINTLTIVGYGRRGINPASQKSFLVTEDLMDTVSLEEVGEASLSKPASVGFKRAMIRRVAEIAKVMHDAGVNHRDFYLAHFLISAADVVSERADGPIHLIDLHRSQIRRRVPSRWRAKDIGGLYFSTARFGLTRRDIFRFVVFYTGMPLREALRDKSALLDASRGEAEKVYRRYFEREPHFPLQFCQHPEKNI